MHSIAKLAGIEIGGTKLQICIADESGSIRESLRFAVDQTGGAASIREQIQTGYKKLKGFETVDTIGVGFGGPVDSTTGTIRTSHQVTGWANFPFKQWLQETTGKQVVVENDANVAALGEAKQGKGKGFKRVFYITVGSGIGGGFIIDGAIYHGLAPGEVEVGHIRMDKKGTTLESRCSGWAVNEKVSVFIQNNPGSMLSRLAEKNSAVPAMLLSSAIMENDIDAKKILEEITDDLAFGLSHVVHLLHPDILVIGGGLSLLGSNLLLPLKERLPRYVMEAFHPCPPIELSALGELAVPVGAIELAREYHLQKIKITNNS